ncbi:MAG: hypothetical protein KCHDKBKB_00775 [Elusimicrobia bacterium]|nr:hypothetical protein [Elusimicrobiota bacterium]
MAKKEEVKIVDGVKDLGLGQEGIAPDKNTSFDINFNDPKQLVPGIRLNIGCGNDIKPNFINVDPFDKHADAPWNATDLPLNDDSVAQIICYQTVEHFSVREAVQFFDEAFRVIKTGGNLIINVPDMINLCERFLKDPEDDYTLTRVYGSQWQPGQFHKSGWTPKRLFTLLGQAGFRFIKVAYFNEVNGCRNIYVDATK